MQSKPKSAALENGLPGSKPLQEQPAALTDAGFIRVAELRQLLEAQGFKCAMTGRELTPATAAFDHKVPLSRGGSHSLDNAQILDADVNATKGSLTVDDFVQLCEQVVAWKDSRRDA